MVFLKNKEGKKFLKIIFVPHQVEWIHFIFWPKRNRRKLEIGKLRQVKLTLCRFFGHNLFGIEIYEICDKF